MLEILEQQVASANLVLGAAAGQAVVANGLFDAEALLCGDKLDSVDGELDQLGAYGGSGSLQARRAARIRA